MSIQDTDLDIYFAHRIGCSCVICRRAEEELGFDIPYYEDDDDVDAPSRAPCEGGCGSVLEEIEGVSNMCAACYREISWL